MTNNHSVMLAMFNYELHFYIFLLYSKKYIILPYLFLVFFSVFFENE